jgi:recombination protein RecR
MMSPLIKKLITSLRCLPGIGPKSAQRMAFHLLQKPQHQHANNLAENIKTAIEQISYCQKCRMYCEEELCSICSHPKRNQKICCVVESPADVLAIEQTASYQGHYFVLHGHLSPIDGIGPQQLGLSQLLGQINQEQEIELILATNPTAEGEATAHYIQQHSPQNVRCSRIAHGVPMGGELEYLDSHTLQHALQKRQNIANTINQQHNSESGEEI